MGSVSVRNISKMSYDSWSLLMYGHFCNSDNGGEKCDVKSQWWPNFWISTILLDRDDSEMAICIVKRWEKSHGLPFCSWLKSSSLSGRRLEEVGERENGRARGRHARGESPSRAPVFSCAHYSQAPATQARNHHAQELSYVSILSFFFCHICICSMITFCWDPEILPP